MMQFDGTLYSKGSSQSIPVHLLATKDALKITHADNERTYKKDQLRIHSPIEGTSLVIETLEGDRIECPSDRNIYLQMRKYGLLKSLSPYWIESKLKLFLTTFVALICISAFLYKVVIPSLSKEIAFLVPDKIGQGLDRFFMDQLDQAFLKPTTMTIEDQLNWNTYFSDHGLSRYRIHFRSSKLIGPNAFALAHNSIILTDELIHKLQFKSYVLGVVLHEIGHLKERHVLQMIIRDSATALLSMAILGDLEGGAESFAELGIVFAARNYMRKHEDEADASAIEALNDLGLSPLCFADGLEKIAPEDLGGIGKYFSTHPDTSERIKKIKDQLNLDKCQFI